jgi:POT family proton-dependent oligopeptide transporter
MVGQLYSEEDKRRDSGYALYYMGINLGSFFGYLLGGYFATKIGWHYAFGAAAVGMGLGLIQYKLTEKNLSTVVDVPESQLSPQAKKKKYKLVYNYWLFSVASDHYLYGVVWRNCD